MAANKLGTVLREARTNAGLTQEQLARKVAGVSAADLSKAERGEGTLTQDQLKQIAKATGVTQASLLNAAKETSSAAAKKPAAKTAAAKKPAAKTAAAKKPAAKTAAAKKPAAAKTAAAAKKPAAAAKTASAAKKPAAAAKKTTAAKKPAAPKTPASAGITMRVTATEKRLIEAYRLADSAAKKNAMSVLKGETGSLAGSLLGSMTGAGSSSSSGGIGDMIADGLSGLVGNLLGGKK